MPDPTPTELPASCTIERIIDDWCTAGAARLCNNPGGVLDALMPDDLPGVDTFIRMRGFLLLGANACAAEIRKQFGDVPTDGVFGFQIMDAHTDEPVDTQAADAADAAALGRLLTVASNNDRDTLEALVDTLIPVTGTPRDARHVIAVLDVYTSLVAGAA